MKNPAPLLLLLALMATTSLHAQSFQHSWGLSFNLLRHQSYSFLQYSQTRPAHLITPTPLTEWLFTMRYNPRWGLLKATETRKYNMELSFPLDIGAFFTTDEFQKKGNYFAMHLPAMLGFAFGEGASTVATTKSKLGGFVAGGASWNLFSGALGKKNYITPCASLGIRTSIVNRVRNRKRLLELSYTAGFLPKKENVPDYFSDFNATRLPEFYLKKVLKYTQNLVSLTVSFNNKSTSSK